MSTGTAVKRAALIAVAVGVAVAGAAAWWVMRDAAPLDPSDPVDLGAPAGPPTKPTSAEALERELLGLTARPPPEPGTPDNPPAAAGQPPEPAVPPPTGLPGGEPFTPAEADDLRAQCKKAADELSRGALTVERIRKFDFGRMIDGSPVVVGIAAGVLCEAAKAGNNTPCSRLAEVFDDDTAEYCRRDFIIINQWMRVIADPERTNLAAELKRLKELKPPRNIAKVAENLLRALFGEATACNDRAMTAFADADVICRAVVDRNAAACAKIRSPSNRAHCEAIVDLRPVLARKKAEDWPAASSAWPIARKIPHLVHAPAAYDCGDTVRWALEASCDTLASSVAKRP